MIIETKTSDQELLVILSGEAQVDDAASIAQEFKTLAAIELPIITFDLAGLTEIDITFIQLLYSLSNALLKRGKHLMIFSLPQSHPVIYRSRLSGIRLEHHFTMAEKTG